jgi:hypothetical protein
MNAQMILNELYATSVNDPAVLALAHELEALTKDFQAGNCSADEYQELLVDFQRQQLIHAQCADLSAKERLNSIINVVINAGSMLTSV